MARGGIGLVLFFLSSYSAFSQQIVADNRRCLEIEVNKPVKADRVIGPTSVILPDSLADLVEVKFLSSKSFVLLSTVELPPFEVCYRLLPAEIGKNFKITTIGTYDSTAHFRAPKNAASPLFSKREELFDLGDINQGGQISRGITVGNTQDLFVNSSLNLSLEGKISEDLNIRASITDQSIPYQPEGNTQQLQDFDNVYVELYNEKYSVIGGDVVFKNGDTRFLKYLKNVQGGALKLNLDKSKTSAGLSAAKGEFASVVVEVSEGVLGPYQIPSNSNDQYLIIIANSEKVYIDGKLLIRGYDNDYIIDYNQAEINFTSNIIITKYTRVRIDYEYAIRNYNRSIVNLSHSQELGKLTLAANYYKEGDNENKPLFAPLSQSDKELLSSVGNNTEAALVSSADPVPYSPDKVLYVKGDTLDSNYSIVEIFKHSATAADSMYAVTFTDVGPGKGSYIISEYLAQGRIYQWVGKGLGDYEPYRQLGAPTKKEMLDITAKLKTGEFSEIYLESAFSNHDLNQFSTVGNEENQGFAIKGGMKIANKPISAMGGYKLNFFADLELLNKNFNVIDRFRRVEFDRDWSYQPVDSIAAQDLVLSSGIGLRKNVANGFMYKFNTRNKEGQVAGFQNELVVNKALGKLQVNLAAFLMNSNLEGQNATWRKLNAETFVQGKIQPGYRYNLQHNLVKYPNDSIISAANYFSSHEIFIRNNPTAKTKFEASYLVREDQAPVLGELVQADKSENARIQFARKFNNGHNVKLTLNYRIVDQLNTTSKPIESITGRVDWNGDIIAKVFRNELNYAVSNARVPRREYVFVEVPTGEGTHTWRDDNQDGIKDLDEFYEAIYFDERNYIKLYVNTTEFLDAYENIFNYRATLTAPRSWRTKAGILNLLSKFSNTTSWASHYRTTEETAAARLIPFFADIDEEQVLSLKEALRTTFFINKANPKFGLSAGYAQYRKKYLYSNGFEARSDAEYNFTLRWNITKEYNLKLRSLTATRINRSDYLEGRNYDIQDYKVGPSFSWQPKPTFRVTGTYTMGLKQSSSAIELPSQSSLNEVMTELKMGMASKYMMNMNVKYSKVAYNGDELTPLGYEMLQGLRPGDNVSWSVGWQQKLINGLQINLFYEGRKPEGIAVIHSGRASVSALF